MCKKRAVFLTIFVIVLSLVLSISGLALSRRVVLESVVYLPNEQQWAGGYVHTRSGMYSTVGAQCMSVYPVNGGLDLFFSIQVKATSEWGSDITDVVVLSENDTLPTDIPIKEGSLIAEEAIFYFRGNSPAYAAEAVVRHDGR